MHAIFCRGAQGRLLVVATALLCLSAPAWAAPDDSRPFVVDVEAGPVWFARNDIRIPGDTGTRFDMTDLTGDGPEFFARIAGLWRAGFTLVIRDANVELRQGSLQANDDDVGFVP